MPNQSDRHFHSLQNGAQDTNRPQAPHNLEAEQALLGAILVNNEALDRVSSFLDPQHFYNPLHQQIYEVAGKLIHAGKQATPITLRTFFESAEPISPTLTVPQYLGTLAGQATTIINAEDYGRTIYDLATRRAMIIIGEDMVNGAYDTSTVTSPAELLGEIQSHLVGLHGPCSTKAVSVSRCLADVEARPVLWFWENRIALGKLSLIAGLPGLGKSQLMTALIASATTGGELPDGAEAPQGSAIVITTEDDAADTIRPRLEAAGADLCRVHIFDWAVGVARDGKPEFQHFNVRTHIAALAELVCKIGDVRLIVIDPITAHLGRTDSHVTAEVRGALAPLQGLASERGTAIVLVTHLNKGSSDGVAMSRVTGSGAFPAVCRSAWLVALDPKDSSKRRRMFVPLKNNLGDDRTGFAFTIESVVLPTGIRTSRVAFEPSPVCVAADELLQPTKHGADDAMSALEEASDFLREILANRPVWEREVSKAAADAGIAKGTLRRARTALRVRSVREGEKWFLALAPLNGSEGAQETQEVHECGRA